jgi:hypothetical protein
MLNHYFVLPVLFSYHDSGVVFLNWMSLLYHFLLVFVGVASTLRLLNKQHQSKLRESELQKEDRDGTEIP